MTRDAMRPELSAEAIALALGNHPPTAEQRQVIEFPCAPLLVIAGAGSGKTETMAARVVWLVAQGLVDPGRILGLTFTRKAVSELSERIRLRLLRLRDSGLLQASDAAQAAPTVSTYNAYAATLVSDYGLRCGIESGTTLLSETDRWLFAENIVRQQGEELARLGMTTSTMIGSLLALAGECQEHLLDPADVADFSDQWLAQVRSLPKNDKGGPPVDPAPSSPVGAALQCTIQRRALVGLVQSFVQAKNVAGVMDFGDQVSFAARIARECPEVGARERERYSVVLLDEYQDTSWAQLVLLRSLFGQGHPVTAVGDPQQSIYGWRGASAGNLGRFPRDFRAEGTLTQVLQLSTAWRNDTSILAYANEIAAPLRATSAVEVAALQPRPRAGKGTVMASWYEDEKTEIDALADYFADQWHSTLSEQNQGATMASMAVLCRRRSQFAAISAALRARGLAVEVVGVGGLLDDPAVAEILTTLELLVDPERGDCAAAVLTGPRWRIGPADMAVLAQWASTLFRDEEKRFGSALTRRPSLVAAVDCLPHADWQDRQGRRLSDVARQRLMVLAQQWRDLRQGHALALVDWLHEIERSVAVDVEVASVPGVDLVDARAALDSFYRQAQDFATRHSTAQPRAFLAWVQAARERESGLSLDYDSAAGPEEASHSAVQILTVHGSKGLEWDVVAIPGLCDKIFPSPPRPVRGWVTSPGALPYSLRGDGDELPQWTWSEADHQQDLKLSLAEFVEELADHHECEERRLAYVAATRARHTLILTGSWWGSGATKPRPPSSYALAADILDDQRLAAGPSEDTNPLLAEPISAWWPHDPLGVRRDQVNEAAELVLEKTEQLKQGKALTGEWAEKVRSLLAQRLSPAQRQSVVLPSHLSTSQMIALAADPEAMISQLRRPLPTRPTRESRLGSHFHAWVEQYYRSRARGEMVLDDLAAEDSTLGRWQRTFLESSWARVLPIDVEVDIETPVEDIVLRGRIDALFPTDHGVDIVDWKTGRAPTGQRKQWAALQLAAYRLAWSRLSGLSQDAIGAVFYYVADDVEVRPDDEVSPEHIAQVLRTIPLAE